MVWTHLSLESLPGSHDKPSLDFLGFLVAVLVQSPWSHLFYCFCAMYWSAFAFRLLSFVLLHIPTQDFYALYTDDSQYYIFIPDFLQILWPLNTIHTISTCVLHVYTKLNMLTTKQIYILKTMLSIVQSFIQMFELETPKFPLTLLLSLTVHVLTSSSPSSSSPPPPPPPPHLPLPVPTPFFCSSPPDLSLLSLSSSQSSFLYFFYFSSM